MGKLEGTFWWRPQKTLCITWSSGFPALRGQENEENRTSRSLLNKPSLYWYFAIRCFHYCPLPIVIVYDVATILLETPEPHNTIQESLNIPLPTIGPPSTIERANIRRYTSRWPRIAFTATLAPLIDQSRARRWTWRRSRRGRRLCRGGRRAVSISHPTELSVISVVWSGSHSCSGKSTYQ